MVSMQRFQILFARMKILGLLLLTISCARQESDHASDVQPRTLSGKMVTLEQLGDVTALSLIHI